MSDSTTPSHWEQDMVSSIQATRKRRQARHTLVKGGLLSVLCLVMIMPLSNSFFYNQTGSDEALYAAVSAEQDSLVDQYVNDWIY